MPSEVKIILSATDKASAQLDKVEKEIKDLGKTTGVTAQGTKRATGAVTDFASALGLANQVLGAAKEVYDEVIGGTIDYARQVRELSQTLGLSSDETSRMIQLADDYLISAEEMGRAMEMATKNGFEPGIEGLAGLADQYKALASPTERAALLSELFGRNWANLVPLMELGGQAVREQAAAIDDSLVMTDSAIKAAREYEIAVDNLNDQLMGTKIAIGNAVIPALTTYMRVGTESKEAGLSQAQTLATLIRAWRDLGKAEAEAVPPIEEAIVKTYETADAAKVAAQQIANTGLVFNDVSGDVERLALAESMAAMEAENANSIYQIQTDALRNLEGAQASLAEAQANWSQGVGTDLASQLEAAVGDTDKFHDALGVLDGVMGTNLLTTEKQGDEMARLIDEYRRKGDLDAFRDGVQKLKDEFMPLNEQVMEAQTNVDNLSRALDNLNGRHVTTYLDIIQTLSGGAPGVSQTGGGGNTSRRAAGGPVSGGQAYIVGEQGPELFVPRASGSIIPNSQVGGDTYYEINITASGQALAALVQQARAMARSGAARYAGR